MFEKMQCVNSRVRVLVRNLKEMERRFSPTSHAAVLLMPTQKSIRQLMDTLDTACEPTLEFTMRAAKFQRIFINNNMDSRDTITEALEVYKWCIKCSSQKRHGIGIFHSKI